MTTATTTVPAPTYDWAPYMDPAERERQAAALHGYMPPYLDPDFQQFLPKGPAWELVNDAKVQGGLRYRDPATGRQVLVPGLWYNQPVAWRIEAMNYSGAAAEERLAYWRASGHRDAQFHIPGLVATIERLRGIVAEMERTGKVLA